MILLYKKDYFDHMICYLSGLGLASGWLSTWTPFSSVSTELPTDEDLYRQYYCICLKASLYQNVENFPQLKKINKI
jgi:hypothetical protein